MDGVIAKIDTISQTVDDCEAKIFHIAKLYGEVPIKDLDVVKEAFVTLTSTVDTGITTEIVLSANICDKRTLDLLYSMPPSTTKISLM